MKNILAFLIWQNDEQTLANRTQNMVRVFNFRSGRVYTVHLLCYRVKRPNLKLKTRP